MESQSKKKKKIKKSHIKKRIWDLRKQEAHKRNLKMKSESESHGYPGQEIPTMAAAEDGVEL